jgi:tetratricopeptide (TPR) repeat protein
MRRIFCILPALLTHAVLADQCDVADALLDAGQLTEAHSAYEMLLKASPLPTCAAHGYITTTNLAIINALATSRNHRQLGNYIAAVDSYEIALAQVSDKSGDTRVNLDGLAALKAEAATALIARAELQAKEGATDLALASFNKALEYVPGAPEALRGISNLRLDTKLAQIRTRASLGDIAGAATALSDASKDNPGLYNAAVASVPGLSLFASYQKFYENCKQYAIFAIIIFIVAFLLYRIYLRYRRPPALALQIFDTRSIDQTVGVAIDTVIKAYMYDLTRGSGGGEVGLLVEQSVEQLEIPSAIMQALPTQLSFASAIPVLVQKIIPRKVQTVTGSLHFTDALGCGITVNLESPGRRALTGYTFWQAHFEVRKDGYGSKPVSTAPYFDLCQYVAVWLLYAIDTRDRFQPLGCRSWSAYVSFRNGVIEELKSKPDKKFARSCYVRALNIQPDFNAPRYNLALQAGRHEYHFSLEPLRRAADNGNRDDPTTYSARYMLANRAYELGRLDFARNQAGILIEKVEERIVDLRTEKKLFSRAGHTDQNRKTLTSFFEIMLRAAKSVHIGLSILIDRDPGLVRELEEISAEVVTPRVHYNIASGYSIAAQVFREDGKQVTSEDDDPEQSEGSDKTSLSYDKLIAAAKLSLQTALFLAPEYEKAVMDDPSLKELLTHYDPTAKKAQGIEHESTTADAEEGASEDGDESEGSLRETIGHFLDLLNIWRKPEKTDT